ncbi:DL-endopeptidase inhibitor IseA family protein [Paenibacillus naphthalenovorans]|uniref:DL-endopeptidase inhibitor IseA family protein n=1 Tax=Paenibacillus naphthalenovorans TaxID=162209 RepID=UPI003D2AFE8E
MKIHGKSFVSGVVLGSVLFSGISFAAPKVVKLMVNGNEIHSEVPAQIIDGSTLVPARALSEALGARVIWDEANQTVIVENEAYRKLQRKNEDITERDAVGLAADAQNHFWVISRGGDGQHISESFSVPGKEHPYRWMGSDLDTKDKFISYIEEIYTPEQAEAYWKKQTENGSIVEIEGKLAQPEADGGSMTGWADAKATLIQDGKGTRSFRFQVPLFDEFEEKIIKLRYVEGKGWRIDEPVDTIR